MTREDRIIMQANRLLGEFVGTLEGILAWDIPQHLKILLEAKIEELNKTKFVGDEHR